MSGSNSAKKRKQTGLFDSGMLKKTKEEAFLDVDVLLDDSIYRGVFRGADEAVKGHYFHYRIKSYNETTKTFTLEYQLRCIGPATTNWMSWPSTGKSLLHGVLLKSAKDGKELYLKALGRVDGKKNDELELAHKLLKAQKVIDADDFSDVDKIAAEEESGKAFEILELEFGLTGAVGKTSGGADKRQWRHKVTLREFWQYGKKNKDDVVVWDRGSLWNNELECAAKASRKQYPAAVARAEYILKLRRRAFPAHHSGG